MLKKYKKLISHHKNQSLSLILMRAISSKAITNILCAL
jgi:hypothetical protein